MKKTKNIFAALLAVMMVLMMVPFAASAAAPDGPYTATYVCEPNADESDKVGNYTFNFYKVATLDKETGKYTAVTADTALVNAINAGNSADAKIACDRLYKANNNVFGTAATAISYTAEDTTQTATVREAGIYYIACTAMPTDIASVASSLVALPYYNSADGVWKTTYTENSVNLASKIVPAGAMVPPEKSASTPSVSFTNKEVTYTIEAKTAGSEQNPLKVYEIADTMHGGLTLKQDTIAVYLDDSTAALVKDTDYVLTSNENSFTVALTEAFLASKAFLAADEVKVVYNAELNESAEYVMPNDYYVEYGNGGNDPTTKVEGDPVNVYSYGVSVYKVDGNDTTKVLEGAEFTVYTDEACTTELKVDNKKVMARTDDKGKANFMLEGDNVPFRFDANITYYVKETKAPTGYSLSDTVYTVTIDTTKEFTEVNNGVVYNYAVVLPQTGGMGTLMFTIGGAALIACAGVLLFVLKRKSSAK